MHAFADAAGVVYVSQFGILFLILEKKMNVLLGCGNITAFG
jgi:hypothetical protein